MSTIFNQAGRFIFRVLGTFVLVLVVDSAAAQTPVEPLLQKYCLGCHNDTDRETGLSLQTMDSLKKGSENGPVFDSANPASSLLMKVLSRNNEQAMPPDGEPQPTDAERERLRQWVLAGARIQSMAVGVPEVPTVRTFRPTTPSLLASAVLPGGQAIVVGGSRFVALRDSETGADKWHVTLADVRVTSLKVASAQPWIVAASGMPGVLGRTLLLSVADGSVVKEFGGHTDAVYAAVLNHDDTILATAGYDRRILLHDVASGRVLRSLDGHNGSVFSLSFDPTGRVLCSASGDGTVKVWNVATGERLDTLSQPQAEQYAVLVGGSGRSIFAAGADNRIRIWNLVSLTSAQINPMQVSRFAHEQPITRLSLSPDGQLLASAAEDRTVRIWTTNPFAYHETLPPQSVAVTSMAFVDSTRLFVTRIDGSSEILSVKPQNSESREAPPSHALAAAKIALPAEMQSVQEVEGNNEPATAQAIPLPARISGAITPAGGNDQDVDCFRFFASAGQQLVLEVRAQQDKSPLDSRIEVLTADGQPILRTQLQAVRDSYFTFRGKDSDTVDDFRVFNWQEMELNEYLYADGEVVRLWLYPRGPDSGFKVYPGFGKRFTYFGTTATAHALQAPCFIVVPRRPDEQAVPNGLPTFPVYYENDDDPRREAGRDSRLLFTAPAEGDYVVRLTDARGFSGPDYSYQLMVRSPQPNFEVAVNTRKVSVAAGTGKELAFTAKRIDGYEGPVTVDITGLPEGFGFSGPIEIQKGQLRAFGTIYARNGAAEPTAEDLKKIGIVASSEVHGERDLGSLEELKLTADPKLRVQIKPLDVAAAAENSEQEATPVLEIRPGETIRAVVRLERLAHDGVVSLGREDAGRNMPYGVFVDNIGLNGLLLLDGQSEREFFITAARWVPESTSTFFLTSGIDGITSMPVTLKVLSPPDARGDNQVTTR